MIEITKMDGRIVLVNENLIETVESNPDTVVIMANGRKFIVQETITEVMKKCNERWGIPSSAPLVSTSEQVVKERVREAVHRL